MGVFWWWDLMHQLHRTVGIWLDVVYISRGYFLVGRGFLSWVCRASFSRYWFIDSVLLGLVVWWPWRLCRSLWSEERSSWELLRSRYSGEGYLLDYADKKCVGVVLTCVGVSVGLWVCSLLFCVFCGMRGLFPVRCGRVLSFVNPLCVHWLSFARLCYLCVCC